MKGWVVVMKRITIVVSDEMYEEIENMRGLVSRSAWFRDFLERHLGEEKEEKER